MSVMEVDVPRDIFAEAIKRLDIASEYSYAKPETIEKLRRPKRFLEVSIPDEPFPKVNTSEEFRERRQRRQEEDIQP